MCDVDAHPKTCLEFAGDAHNNTHKEIQLMIVVAINHISESEM